MYGGNNRLSAQSSARETGCSGFGLLALTSSLTMDNHVLFALLSAKPLLMPASGCTVYCILLSYSDPAIVEFGPVVLGSEVEEVVTLKNFLPAHISVKLKVSLFPRPTRAVFMAKPGKAVVHG